VAAYLEDVSQEGAEVDTPEFGHGIFPQQVYLEFLRDERPDCRSSWSTCPPIASAQRSSGCARYLSASLGPTSQARVRETSGCVNLES